jgi:hypothetical protein
VVLLKSENRKRHQCQTIPAICGDLKGANPDGKDSVG